MLVMEDKPEGRTNESGGEGDPANKVSDQRETVMEKKDRRTSLDMGVVRRCLGISLGVRMGWDGVDTAAWVGRVRDMGVRSTISPETRTQSTTRNIACTRSSGQQPNQVKSSAKATRSLVYSAHVPRKLSGAGMNFGKMDGWDEQQAERRRF